MLKKIYALVGPHGCGKSDMLEKLVELGIHYIPTYTTREPTKDDEGHNLYKFINKTTFFSSEWILKVTYKGEYYGVKKEDMLRGLNEHGASVMLIDTNGIKQVSKLLRGSLESIYIMIDYVSLVDNLLHMGYKNDAIKYHLEYAENNGEFNAWKTATHVVKYTQNREQMMDQLLSIMGLMSPSPQKIAERK